MEKLTKEQAKSIVNWFNENGDNNWGTWCNYPKLPTGASYLQYDDVKCVIKLDEVVGIEDDGELVKFNYISSSRKHNTAKAKGVMSFFTLEEFSKTEEEKNTNLIDSWKKSFERAKAAYKQQELFEAQSDEIKEEIEKLNQEECDLIGTPHSKKRRSEIHTEKSKYALPAILKSQPWAFGEKGWMTIANGFDNVENYIEFKKTQITL